MNIYIDTSGSISKQDVNYCLEVSKKFSETFTPQNLILWHTSCYLEQPANLAAVVLTNDDIQAGGTHPQCVIDHINTHKPHLSIIFTDGYYGDARIAGGAQLDLTCRVVWVILKGGDINHPLKDLGITVEIEKV